MNEKELYPEQEPAAPQGFTAPEPLSATEPNATESPDSYRTGDTEPGKNRTGLVIALLVGVILLGSLSALLGFMNFKLYQKDVIASGKIPLQFSNDVRPTLGPTIPEDQQDFTIPLHPAPQAVENIPQEGGLSLQSIYEKALPSVVSVLCNTPTGTSTGTGVILSEDGYIVTNCHVVENAVSVQVLLQNDTTLSAMVVGADKISDLAVLYVECTGLIPAEFGSSDSLRVGDSVVAIGDPLGTALRGTMTDGIISAINRDITSQGRTMTLIQTNVALNSGNSGGPLLNCFGQVVGINTLKIGDYMDTAGVEGLGFAIPSNTVKEVADQLIRQGFVSGRPFLGLTGETVSPFLQYYYRLPQGVYVTAVDPNSSAQRAGIAVNDIILYFGDMRITQLEDLTTALYACSAGDQVDVVIYRSGIQYTATITIDQAS